MKFVTPILIDEAKLVSSSLLENEYPAWAAGTHAAGERVIRTATHSVYQCTAAVTSSTPPESDAANWERVGPTNKFAAFDQAVGTASVATSTMTFTIAPGLVGALVLMDLTGNQVVVSMSVSGSPVYSRTVNLNAGDGVVDAYTYCFSPIVLRRTVVLTDLPPYATGEITITISGTGSVGVGTVAVGPLTEVGGTQLGGSIDMIDYSKKTTDQWGVTTVVERPFARRLTLSVWVDRAMVDEVIRQFELLRATALVCIGTDVYEKSVVYGFYKSWSMAMRYQNLCLLNFTFEGLS